MRGPVSRPDAHESEAEDGVAEVVREPAARCDGDRLVAVGPAFERAAARDDVATVAGGQCRLVVAFVHRSLRTSPLPNVADHVGDALRRVALWERADGSHRVRDEVRAPLFPSTAPRIPAR